MIYQQDNNEKSVAEVYLIGVHDFRKLAPKELQSLFHWQPDTLEEETILLTSKMPDLVIRAKT